VDFKCTHHNCSYWVWCVVTGMGHWPAGLGGGPRCHVSLRLCDILYFSTSVRLLSLRRSLHWQAQLYLHGCCSSQPKYAAYIIHNHLLNFMSILLSTKLSNSFVLFSDGIKVKICGYLQYANIVGVAIGYTIAASVSMV
jgi:hypothetical protein